MKYVNPDLKIDDNISRNAGRAAISSLISDESHTATPAAVSTLYLGSFDAERFWRPVNLASLPAIQDRQADAIVSTMDELQFAFCTGSDDVLISRFPMDKCHTDYLEELGYKFRISELCLDATVPHTCINQLLCETSHKNYLLPLISSTTKFSPYAVTPFVYKMCSTYNISTPLPSIQAAIKVNSKLYSHELAECLAETDGEIANSAVDISELGARLLERGPFLIKDAYGVSGKGNLPITSQKLLDRVTKHISKQESQGMSTRFLLEPLLDKLIDFSCQFEIDHRGGLKILSVQQMYNSGFVFGSIRQATNDLHERLDRSSYFDVIDKLASCMYRDGYFGPVCLDSMILKNGTVVPIVEINARKSMGFISNSLTEKLSRYADSPGRLTHFSLILSRPVEFEELIHKMHKANILFSPYHSNGIVPLTANTINCNCTANKRSSFKGRFYAFIVAENSDSDRRLIDKAYALFEHLGMVGFREAGGVQN